jgi:hypothetical protein
MRLANGDELVHIYDLDRRRAALVQETRFCCIIVLRVDTINGNARFGSLI